MQNAFFDRQNRLPQRASRDAARSAEPDDHVRHPAGALPGAHDPHRDDRRVQEEAVHGDAGQGGDVGFRPVNVVEIPERLQVGQELQPAGTHPVVSIL